MAPSSLVPIASPFFLLALATGAGAQCEEEDPVQHWTGAGTVVCPCFVSGEEAGATFELPASEYPIEILRVGIGWGSVFGGAPQSFEDSINVYAGGLPAPGVPIASLPGPVLTDGFINEFDLEPLPGEIIINSGKFTVTLRFFNDSTTLGPSMVHDGNGCQGGGKNVVKAAPGIWHDACTLGVSGDWLVHVVYRRVNCDGDCPDLVYCDTNPDNAADIAIDGCDCSAGSIHVWLTGAPVSQFAYLLVGTGNGTVTDPPGAVGDLCLIGSQIGRYTADAGVTNGSGSLSTDVLNAVSGGGGGNIPNPPGGNLCTPPGQTWNFQYWHRDGMNPSKFSKAIQVTFQ